MASTIHKRKSRFGVNLNHLPEVTPEATDRDCTKCHLKLHQDWMRLYYISLQKLSPHIHPPV